MEFKYVKSVVLRSALVTSYTDYKNIHGMYNKIPEDKSEASALQLG
jgi:hypothetical protein